MYIEQGYKGKLGIWKYFIIPILFFGLMTLNVLVTTLLGVDAESIIQQEIARKGSNRFLVEMLIPFAVFLAGLFFWVKYIHEQSIRSLTTSRKRVDWRRIFFAFTVWAGITLLVFFIDYFSNPQDYILQFDLPKFAVLAVIALLLIPLQTSFEEYFFRGYLMQGLGIITKNRWFPLVFTSVVFGLMHISNPEVGKLGPVIMIYYIGTGFFLGIITLMDEGLELAIGFHAANNLITALLVTSDWTAFQTHSVFKDVSLPTAGNEIFLTVLVLFPLLTLLFAKKYGWTNWKEKLTAKVIPPVKHTSEG